MSKWLRRVGWVIAGVLGLWALAWLAVPPLLKSQGERRASEALGRAVTLGAVEFEPWSLRLTLRDLVIAGRAGVDVPLLSIARVHADLDIRSLPRGAPVVESLAIGAPRLRIARLADGRYDFDDVLERLQPPLAAGPGEPARFALYNVQLADGEVVFEDEVRVTPQLAFRLNGAAFDSGGEATPFAVQRAATMHLRVPDLDLATVSSAPTTAPNSPN